ncbi:hypothetical protein LSTR_LSTR015775 [Laodelphax striatellus]|uniref:Secreted protein n=1 Tax=Laodelphax striatellus TaxID=195883 RepID=A0A482XUE2_LAOST|nr:hypothetical protein LSTR_LSTR015775 [Laodelphax striatellus]
MQAWNCTQFWICCVVSLSFTQLLAATAMLPPLLSTDGVVRDLVLRYKVPSNSGNCSATVRGTAWLLLSAVTVANGWWRILRGPSAQLECAADDVIISLPFHHSRSVCVAGLFVVDRQ